MNTNTNKTSNNVMTVAVIVMAAFTSFAASTGHTTAARTSAASPAAKVAKTATPAAKPAPAAAKHSSALDAAVVAPWTRVV
jgi:Mn2+/Fe2+ NRAMP family transporter